MKTLTLVRHAKSSWKDPALDDRDRPLSGRGKREAPETGRRLAERSVAPDALLTSPAKRARSTARKIAREIGFPLEAIREEEALYEATLPALVEVVRRLDPAWGHVLLVGHNPGFSELADFLARGTIGTLPTCAAVCLQLGSRAWAGVEEASGTSLFLEVPRAEGSGEA